MKVAAVLVAALAALLLARGQAMAEDIRVDCVTDQRIVCRDDETACRAPVRGSSATYHFTFDLTEKTGSLVFCADGSCMEPSPLSVVHDYCAALRDYSAFCLTVHISVWEPSQEQTYTITNARYVMTMSGIATDHSLAVTEFGHCAVHYESRSRAMHPQRSPPGGAEVASLREDAQAGSGTGRRR
jgi:hypothetical protein